MSSAAGNGNCFFSDRFSPVSADIRRSLFCDEFTPGGKWDTGPTACVWCADHEELQFAARIFGGVRFGTEFMS